MPISKPGIRAIKKFAIAMAAGAMAVGVGGLAASSADTLKVGFVYHGQLNDFGWNYQHELGRLAIERHFGNKVSTTYLAYVDEGPDAERAVEQLARSGQKLIFATSFGYSDATLKVAVKNPDVFFEQNAGDRSSANVATYSSRFYEGRYIQGQIAARMSKTGILGYIASLPIPEVISGINATMLGAQTINPKIKVRIVWLNTFFDSAKEADAANALLDYGADILMQHTESTAAMQIAFQRNMLAFGQNSDMIKFGPKSQMTAIIDNWAPYYIDRVQDVLDGKWTSGQVWGGLKSKLVVMARYTNLPDDVKEMAIETEAAIAGGTVYPFGCPIFRENGTAIECTNGTHLDDEQVLRMNFYVKGVDAKIPGK
jgi:basic membrane protein A and related proteins